MLVMRAMVIITLVINSVDMSAVALIASMIVNAITKIKPAFLEVVSIILKEDLTFTLCLQRKKRLRMRDKM